MQTHAIIEIEEGTLNVVVGGREGEQVRVHRSVRVPLSDHSPEALQTALRGVDGDLLRPSAGLHVVLADRRSQHFVNTIPRMSSRDAVAFVTREAMRVCNAQTASDVMIATRLIRRLPGGKMVVGTTAVMTSAWAPIARVFEELGLQVASLQSVEACLAMAVDSSSEPMAVLECNAGRVRFVLSCDSTPVQVRRFLVGGGDESNASAIVTQLMMELPRTLDWLRETGSPQPKSLLLGPRVPADDESLDMLRGDSLSQVTRANDLAIVGDKQSQPTLGVIALLGRLVRKIDSGSLLDEPKLHLPMSRGHLVSVLAAASLGVLCGYSAVVDGGAWLENRAQIQQVDQTVDRFEVELSAQEDPIGDGAQMLVAPEIEAALKTRRPVSRLVSEVSNCAGADVHLEELLFASRSTIGITGQVKGDNRQQALAAMGRFTSRLREIPFVKRNGAEEVTEVGGGAHRFRFKLSLTWRNQ